MALEACEEKWYNEGFADDDNSVEPVVNQARKIGFEARWFAALQVLGVPEDSPLRDPDQIPFPSTAAAVQNPLAPIEEEEIASMKELAEQIDAHAESNDMEATSIPHTQDQLSVDPLFSEADQQQTKPDPQHDLFAKPYFYNFSLSFFIFTAFLSFPTICLVNLPMSPGMW